MRTYIECGGTDLPQEQKVMIALKTFPQNTPTGILAPLRKSTTYDELKHNIREEITWLDDFGQNPNGQLHFMGGGMKNVKKS